MTEVWQQRTDDAKNQRYYGFKVGDFLLIFLMFVMPALWHHVYLTGLLRLRDAAAVRYLDMLVMITRCGPA